MCPAKHKNEILSCPLLQSRVFPLAQFHGVGAPFKTRARPLWVTYFNGKGVFCLSLSHTLCLVLVYAVLPITIMITCHAKLWLHVRCRRFWSRFLAQATSFNRGALVDRTLKRWVRCPFFYLHLHRLNGSIFLPFARHGGGVYSVDTSFNVEYSNKTHT